MAQKRKFEITLAGKKFVLNPDWEALARIEQAMAPLRPDIKAYSYWDALEALYRAERGVIKIASSVLATWIWGSMHVEDRAGELIWAGLDPAQVRRMIGETIGKGGDRIRGEYELFNTVWDALYAEGVIPEVNQDDPKNPTVAVDEAATKTQ